jgi:hypothetical protein
MFAAWVLSMTACVFAGIGVKWTVDRVWPPPPRLLEIPPEARPHEPKLTALDDTMDVLGAGVDVGLRMARHARPESTLGRLGLPADAAVMGNGWVGGPYVDGPSTERPADWWPDEIEASLPAPPPRVQEGIWHPGGTPR